MARFVLLLIPVLVAGLAWCEGNDFVRVSPRNPHYFELSSGQPYIPIGLNMIFPPHAPSERESFALYERWFAALAANGGNYIRVWLSYPSWDVEHEKSGLYDETRARLVDRMLDLARKYGIRVKMTMEHFRSIGDYPGEKGIASKPLHLVSNGGTAESTADFFNGERSREQFRRKIAWYAKRYGDQPVIFGWELWNEVNVVRGGDYLAWSEAMLAELHRAFPRNLAMQSLGSFDRPRKRDDYRRLSTMPGNDVAQVHRYLDLGAEMEICHGPVDVSLSDAIRELIGYGPRRPVILAESGAVEPRHSGPFKLYGADRRGIILHDVLFAPFFSGSAGPGQIWHWDHYVAANDLWWHFGRFAEVVKGVDPPQESFEPVMAPHNRLRVYVLKGKRTILAWCRDSRNDWMSELRDKQEPETLRKTVIDLRSAGVKNTRSARVYDPWRNRWTKAPMRGGTVLLPEFSRSIVVRLDRVE